jgi:hypothetical protein
MPNDRLREALERLGALPAEKPEHPPTGRLQVPVPPGDLLERALGYAGDAEWVCFWWEPAGDEARWSDGQRSADAEWTGYLLYTRHPRVAPALWPYELGSSDTEARHKLLLHRPTRQLYAETAREADRTVHGQWPWEKEEDLTAEEWAEIRERMTRAVREALSRPQSEILAEMRAHQEHHARAMRELRASPDGGVEPDISL